jgi:hypothetical protein
MRACTLVSVSTRSELLAVGHKMSIDWSRPVAVAPEKLPGSLQTAAIRVEGDSSSVLPGIGFKARADIAARCDRNLVARRVSPVLPPSLAHGPEGE